MAPISKLLASLALFSSLATVLATPSPLVNVTDIEERSEQLEERSDHLDTRYISEDYEESGLIETRSEDEWDPDMLPDPKDIPDADDDAYAESNDLLDFFDDPVTNVTKRGPPKGKRCLAWRNEFPNALHYWNAPSVSGLYTWTPDCPKKDKLFGIPCWPMFWGFKSRQKWKQVKRGYAKMALFCNEPNIKGQSTMSPRTAGGLWWDHMVKLKGEGYSLASCAPASGPKGLAWIKQFIRENPGAWKDTKYAAAHCYSNEAKRCITYLKDYHAIVKRPILLTEFGCHLFSKNKMCSRTEVKKFMREMLDFVDKTSWMRSACWFGMYYKKGRPLGKYNGLMDSKGRPNELGKYFLYH